MRFAYLVLIFPPLIWAGNYVVGRAIGDQIAPLNLAFWRWFLAALIVLPFVLKPIWQQRQLIRQHLVALLFISITGISAFNTLAYIGLQSTSVTNGSLFNSLIPIFIIILSRLFFNISGTTQQVWGIFISFFGVLLILSQLSLDKLINLSFNQGDLWMLVAGIDWAIYSILLKHHRPPEISNFTLLGITIILGCIILFPIYLWNPWNEPTPQFNQDVILALAYVVIFASLIAFFAWNYALAKVDAHIGGQFVHLLPIFGAILGMIFLGESLQIYHLIGGGLIAVGLLLSLNAFNFLVRPQRIQDKQLD